MIKGYKFVWLLIWVVVPMTIFKLKFNFQRIYKMHALIGH